MDVRPVVQQVERRAAEVRTPGRLIRGVRRIAIVRADRIGDFVLTLPAIDAVRGAYPDAAVTLFVAPSVRPLAERVPGIDRVHAVTTGARHLRDSLRQLAPDVVVCVSRSPASAWAAWRARVPHRVGTGRRFWSPLFGRTVCEPRRSGGRHEVEYALSFAHRAGAPGAPARFALDADPGAAAQVDEWLSTSRVGSPFVVLVPGSGGSCPRWPGRHHARLAALLRATGVSVVVSVGPADRVALDELRAERPTDDLPVFRLGPVELVALVERAALVVGSSTAPIHLAAARATPALALHAPWTSCAPSRWGPYHERGFAIVADRVDLRHASRRARIRHGAAVLDAISPEVVARAVRAMLDGSGPSVDPDQPPHGA